MTRVLSLVTLILALLAAPLGAQTPPGGKVYRIAVVHPSLSVADMTEAEDPHFKAFFSELRRLGYVEGRNLLVERRSGEGHTARHPELAREVVRLQPDLIFVISARLARAFQAATTTVPTVGITPDSWPTAWTSWPCFATRPATLTGSSKGRIQASCRISCQL